MKTKQYRQGDVFIERITDLPEGLTKVKSPQKVILARGEVTGHHHSFDSAVVDEFCNSEGRQFYRVRGEPFKLSLKVERTWKNQVLVKLPTGGLVEFSKNDVEVENGVARIDGDFAFLDHQEHTTLGIPAGIYQGGVEGTVRQREYTPQEIRRVAD